MNALAPAVKPRVLARPAGDGALMTGVVAALLVTTLLMIVTGLQFGRESQRGRELRDAVNHSYETREQIQRVFSLLQDAEAGERGYVITADEAFLRPYRNAVAEAEPQIDRLERMLGDEPGQSARMAQLREVSALKFEELGSVVTSMQSAGPEQAQRRVADGRGRLLMDQARIIVDAMTRAEADNLAGRVAEEQRRTRRAELAVISLFVLLGTAIAISASLLVSYIRRRRLLQVRVEETATRQQAILDSATDAIITLNRSGSIESINAAGERMFGWSAGELMRRDLTNLLDVDQDTQRAFLDRLLGTDGRLGDRMARPMDGRRRDGATFPAEVTFGGMDLTDGRRVVAIIRDISERRRTERMKEEFVSTVSHELRTPLTSIAGSLGLVTGGAAGAVPERALKLVAIAQNNCQRLVRLINDILDVEKMESGKARFDLRTVPLAEVAARSIEEVRGYADGFGVTLRLETSEITPMVRADMDRLVQVATNLLSNAAKFSAPGSEVSISVESLEGAARLSVRDHGPGIPEAFRSRIFSKFAQADGSDTRQKGGTGLGLAIALEIMERHGGKLWFENPSDGGAHFFMELPKVGEHASLENGVRLLICEDEVVTAAALTEVLEDEGFIVDVAESLADAEQALRRTEYACLVMDLNLPDGDGFALIRRLRTGSDNTRMPIIVVSGDAARRREQARSLALDVVAWMTKPVDPARLKDAILTAVAGERRPLILHVDDDEDMLKLAAAALSGCGEVVSTKGLETARALLKTRWPDVVVLDLGLADGSGLDLLPDLTDAQGRTIPVVVFSAQDDNAQLSERVDSVLTKSRTSLSSLARTVRRLTRPARSVEREREATI